MTLCVLAVVYFDLHSLAWFRRRVEPASQPWRASLRANWPRTALPSRIADLDTQQTTCTEWASDRAEAGIEPEIQVQPFGNLNTALAEATRFNAYILDGRPHSSRQTIEIAKAAHLIVIPTGQTKDDLRPAVKLAHNLVDCGIDRARMAFALVKTTRSAAEIAAAQAYLKQTDYTLLEGFLPISTAYGIAHDAGKTVTETPYRSLNEQAERLAQAMIDLLVSVTATKENL